MVRIIWNNDNSPSSMKYYPYSFNAHMTKFIQPQCWLQIIRHSFQWKSPEFCESCPIDPNLVLNMLFHRVCSLRMVHNGTQWYTMTKLMDCFAQEKYINNCSRTTSQVRIKLGTKYGGRKWLYIPSICFREAQNVRCFYLFCLGVSNLHVWGQQKIKP